MIDWTTVIVTVLGFVTIETVFRIIDRVRYKREDRRLKKNVVENSDLDNESKRLDNDIKQMDVGSMYLEKVQKLADMMEESAARMVKSSTNRDGDWAELKGDVARIKEVTAKIEADVAQLDSKYDIMEEYLNGGFAKFRAEMAGKIEKHIIKTRNRYETKNKKDAKAENPRKANARKVDNPAPGCEALPVPAPVGGDL